MTNTAFDAGYNDARAGRDYANPYIPPRDAGEEFAWKPQLEEDYHLGYEAGQKETE